MSAPDVMTPDVALKLVVIHIAALAVLFDAHDILQLAYKLM